MAKGTITFEFESLPDLDNQLRAALGMKPLWATGETPEKPAGVPIIPRVLIKKGEGLALLQALKAAQEQAAETPTGAGTPSDQAAALAESGKTLRQLVEEQTKAEQAENDRRLDLAVASGRPFVPLGSDVAAQQAAQLATTILKGDPSTPIGEMSPTPPTATEETTSTPEPEKTPETVTKTPETVTETLTLETLADAPYPELLAFCERNPGVGVDVAKSQPAFFRKLVEIKVKTFLETK